MKLFSEMEYTPRTVQEFYCKICDRNHVNSAKPESGKFFQVHGHSFDQKTKEYDGEYVGVMFAVCSDCLKE